MRIETSRFGAVEIEEKDLFELPDGLIGLPDFRRFFLVEDEAAHPFKWLQSLDEPTVAFVVIEPTWLLSGYLDRMPAGVGGAVGVVAPEQMAVLVLVTIPKDTRRMTANLKGPVVINKATGKGVQLVLDDDKLSLRHPIVPETARG